MCLLLTIIERFGLTKEFPISFSYVTHKAVVKWAQHKTAGHIIIQYVNKLLIVMSEISDEKIHFAPFPFAAG